MKKINVILSVVLLTGLMGCASSPGDLRLNESPSRFMVSDIKGSLSNVVKCIVKNLDEMMPNWNVIQREKNSSSVIELQQRGYGTLFILHDIEEINGMVKIKTYIAPNDITPFYTKNIIEKVVFACK